MKPVDDPAWGRRLMSVSDETRTSVLGWVISLVIVGVLGPMMWAIVAFGAVVLLFLKLLGHRRLEAIYENGVVYRQRWSFGFVPWTQLKLEKVDRRRLFSPRARWKTELSDRHGQIECLYGPAQKLLAESLAEWAPVAASGGTRS